MLSLTEQTMFRDAFKNCEVTFCG